MGRYFGTDGVRGKANVTLDVDRAFAVGKYLGFYYKKKFGHAKIVVGKDTRISGSMFESAIAAGASSTGAKVYLLGTCPTPTVAYLTTNFDYNCGIMISASHNPYYDNGIKVFSHEGIKINADIESEIEDFIDGLITIPYSEDGEIGIVENYPEGLIKYLNHIEGIFNLDLSEYNIAIDCANGSSSVTAEKMLRKLNANLTVIHSKPDGVNINTNCGSTHPGDLQKLIKDGNYDVGFAFDGDADRLITVNSKGELVDGDYALYICSKYLKESNEFVNNTVVTTVMANLGFFKALEKIGVDYKSTQVGDKYVYECMVNGGYILGGEQSGHIIFKEHATTGDGLLTALKLLEVMTNTNKSIIELSEGLDIYTQLLINVNVNDKNNAMFNEKILALVESINIELNGNGRILVRASGTEPLVRVMVEAETDELCSKYVYKVVDLINELKL
jgi:phosphoglucosamine mutase